MSKEFYKKQSDLTAAKIKVYQEYIKGYLPKILQTFRNCLIADLFCGKGNNGNEDGSPLVLIEQAKYILTSPNIKNSKVCILFNDRELSHIENLKSKISDFSHESIDILPIRNTDFQTILVRILKKIRNNDIPKFFFLDPFTYSDVKMEDLKEIMSLKNSEVFLFTPIFHSYRFSSASFPETHKTKVFVEEFTTKGMDDYSDINDFMQSIKEKLKQELQLDYVRPVLLDDGNCKNAIFLLTKHQAGMLLMNKIAFNQSEDGAGVDIRQQQSKQTSLFGLQETRKFDVFSKKLRLELENKKQMTNDEIVNFTIMEGFLPKHAKDVLNVLSEATEIIVYDDANINITNQKGKWNIAEKITKKVTFNYGN